jgi:pimeloyl-ACP methyl ester carboxylesterase
MRLHVVRTGAGPPLVLLHGLGADLATWDPVVPLLAPRRDVIAIDLPGFGGSPPVRGEPPTAAALARSVAAELDALGVHTAHLAGNSLGGWVALELVRLGRGRTLTLLSPAGFFGRGGRAWARNVLRGSRALARALSPLAPFLLGSRAGRSVLLAHVFGRPSRVPPAAAVAAVRALASAPGFRATLRATHGAGAPFATLDGDPRVPITIAWGTRDRLLWPRQARRAA